MKVLFLTLVILGAIRWGFPIAMGQSPFKTQRWDETSAMNAALMGEGNLASSSSKTEAVQADTCTWTCGPDPMNSHLCQGAIFRNGFIARSESRQTNRACDSIACASVFSDYSAECPHFEAN